MFTRGRFWFNFIAVGVLALVVGLFVGSYSRALNEYELAEGWKTLGGVLSTFGGIAAFWGLALGGVIVLIALRVLYRLLMKDYSNKSNQAIGWAVVILATITVTVIIVVNVFTFPSGEQWLSLIGGGIFLAAWLGTAALFTRK